MLKCVICGSSEDLTRCIVGLVPSPENIYYLCQEHLDKLLEFFNGKKLCECCKKQKDVEIFYKVFENNQWIKKPFPLDEFSQK